VYALAMEEEWKQVGEAHSVPASDVNPGSPWNCGRIVEESDPGKSFGVAEKSVGEQPWTAGAAPVRLTGRGGKIPWWQEYCRMAGPLPAGSRAPVDTPAPAGKLELTPYGCTQLRISGFPVVPGLRPEEARLGGDPE
jgi:uncharacterized protein